MAKKGKKGQKTAEKNVEVKETSPVWKSLENNKYLPFILYFLLAMIYFAPLIFQSNAILSSEGQLSATVSKK